MTKKNLLLYVTLATAFLSACGAKEPVVQEETEPAPVEEIATVEEPAVEESLDETTNDSSEEATDDSTSDEEAYEELIEVDYSSYDRVIYTAVGASKDGWSNPPEAYELSPLNAIFSANTGFSKIDINNDGILELAFGTTDSVSMIFDLFTLKEDGTLSHLFSSKLGDTMYLSDSYVFEQFSSATSFSQNKYQLENGELVLLEEGEEGKDLISKYTNIDFDLFSNHYDDDFEILDFMPSSEIEVKARKEIFDSYDEIISYLEPGQGYAYAEVLGTTEPVLLVTSGTYDYGDANHTNATLDAEVFFTSDRGVVYGTALSSNSTACPIGVADKLLFGFGYHAISTQCVSSDTNAFMFMASGIIEYDSNGNETYIGFTRDANVLDESKEHDITPEEYEALFAAYENAEIINFIMIE